MIAAILIVVFTFTIFVAIRIHLYFFQNTIKTTVRNRPDSQHTLFDIMDLHCAILCYLDIESLHQCKRVNKDWNKHASHPSSTKTFNVLDYFTKKFFLQADTFKQTSDGNINSLTVLKELYHTLLYLINLRFNWINLIMLQLLHRHQKTKSKITDIITNSNTDCQYKYSPNTRYWFNRCNDFIYSINDCESIRKCKHFDISQFSKCRKLILDLKTEYNGSEKTNDLQSVQNVIQWYVDQMLSKFNNVEEIILIQKGWESVWAPFITLIAHQRNKIVEFKYRYAGSFPLEWWISFIMTNTISAAEENNRYLNFNLVYAQPEILKNSMILNHDKQSGLPKLRVFAHHCCSDFVRFSPPLAIDNSFAQSMGGLRQLILINGRVVIDKSFWVAVANICSNNRQFWGQLELLKIHSQLATRIDHDHDDDIGSYQYDEEMHDIISVISGNIINLKEIDIMSNDYVLYLLLFYIMTHVYDWNKIYDFNKIYNCNLKKVCISGCENALDLGKPELTCLMKTVHEWLQRDEFNFECQDLSVDIWLTYCYANFYNVGIYDFSAPYKWPYDHDQGGKLWEKLLTWKKRKANINHSRKIGAYYSRTNHDQSCRANHNNTLYCDLERLQLMWRKSNFEVSDNYIYCPLKLLGEDRVIFRRFQMLEIGLSCKINVVNILEMMQIIRNKVEKQQQGHINTSHLFMRLYLYDARLALQFNDNYNHNDEEINSSDDDDADNNDAIDYYEHKRRQFCKLLDIVGDWYKFGLTDCFVIVTSCTDNGYIYETTSAQQHRLVGVYNDIVNNHWLSNYCTIHGDKVGADKLHGKLKPVIEQRCHENSYCQISPGFDANKTVTIDIDSHAGLTLFIQNAV